ncbi:hypothetical protein HYH03_000024 [Edaphochlamys debaryana]|uniref:Carboxylic ester hydrolase n=1 Tax=Edaphochlamys debaryana TaxID=47281 RepID=A0A835YGT2_9CHLO|nr:hypothetical protein HYH03_000024 [Edaphochlamys debaryana]|eukprot:KAG2501517.1 hypothetical protein HYH03_000024 [Edaphochlamys debaryana]
MMRAPKPYIEKYPDGVLDATAYRPACVASVGSGEGSEDCLTLNVWAPATRPSTLLPVRVFLHGGGYQVGTGSDPMVNGCALVSDSDIVQVTLNYSLGVLGFLALPELRDEAAGGTTGNWGLLDQRLALQWVRDNIAAFGGDPARVTLTGQSAGAYSTILHTVMPGSVGLFSAIEPLSGSMDAMAVDFLGDAFFKAGRIVEALNCSAHGYASLADCLMGVPAADLVSAKVAVQRSARDDIIPVVDGVEMPKHPLLMMRDTSIPAVPAFVHATAREGVLEVLDLISDALSYIKDISSASFEELYGVLSYVVPDGETVLAIIQALVPIPEAFVDRFHAQYNNATHGNYLEAAIAAQTDNAYLCTSRRAARAYAKKGAAVRFMVTDMALPPSTCISAIGAGVPGLGVAYLLGAFHGYDLGGSYLMPLSPTYQAFCPYFTDAEKNASAFLAGVSSAFAHTRVPLPPRGRIFQAAATDVLRNLTSWPAWTAASEPTLWFDVNEPHFVDGMATMDKTCKLWDDMWEYMVARGSEFDVPVVDASPPPSAAGRPTGKRPRPRRALRSPPARALRRPPPLRRVPSSSKRT